MAKLVQISGSAPGREYPLGELCIIGRSPHAHVRLPERTVSRQHAKITRDEAWFIIEDLDSSRGTAVNGLAVTASKLRPGDEITVVDTVLRFEDQPVHPMSTSEFSLAFEGQDPTPLVDEPLPNLAPPDDLSEREEDLAGLRYRVETLLSVGQLASGSLETDATLRHLLDRCLELFPAAHRALVAVPDRTRRTLTVRSLVLRDGVEEQRFHLSRTVTSEVLGRGMAILHRGTLALTGPDGTARRTPVPMMVAPLAVQGKKLGLLYVDRLGYDEIPPFTDDDLPLLNFVAGQVALVLRVAQLQDRLVRNSLTRQELAAAREVQKRFLPRGVPRLPGFTFLAHYDPCQKVGGDLYDFIPLDSRRIGIVIGDVSGKGFAAALVMAWVTSQLRLAAHQERRPGDVLGRINDSLIEARQDELFVTLFYGVLDRLLMNLSFCNAGHMPPLVRKNQEGVVERVETGAGLPVGLVPDATFEEGTINMGRGDTVVLYSDGVTEARAKDGEMFGMERLEASLRHGSSAAPDRVAALLRELRAFAGEQPQSDDITIVAVGAGLAAEDIRTTLPPGGGPPPF